MKTLDSITGRYGHRSPNSGRKQSEENKYGNDSGSDDFIFWPLRRNAFLQAATDVAQDRWRRMRRVKDRLDHVVQQYLKIETRKIRE